MALDAATQALVTAASCNFCKAPAGLAYYMVLAELINLNNGATMPTDSDTLISQAGCLFSCIPQGLLPYTLLAAVQGISAGGAGGGGQTGVVSPQGSVTGTAGSTYYDSVAQTFWVNTDGGTTWVQLI